MAGGAMLAGKWSGPSIFATVSIPIFIAALATVCVRFSRHTDAMAAERTPPPYPPPHAGAGKEGASAIISTN
jgi:hypothetical protein